MHRQVTEVINFESAFYFSIVVGVVAMILKYQYMVLKHREIGFTKDMKRNFLLVIRELCIFIDIIIVSTLITLGFFSSKLFEINIVNLLVIIIFLIIIKRITNLVIMKGELKDGDA